VISEGSPATSRVDRSNAFVSAEAEWEYAAPRGVDDALSLG
jgi:hypothetical protein